MITNNIKIKYWNKYLIIMITLFISSNILGYIIVPEETIIDSIMLNVLFICFIISILMSIIFTINMIYHAYKMQRYLWMLSNIIFGSISSIIFYIIIIKQHKT